MTYKVSSSVRVKSKHVSGIGVITRVFNQGLIPVYKVELNDQPEPFYATPNELEIIKEYYDSI